jgi:hypothetical protein
MPLPLTKLIGLPTGECHNSIGKATGGSKREFFHLYKEIQKTRKDLISLRLRQIMIRRLYLHSGQMFGGYDGGQDSQHSHARIASPPQNFL